jgi:hypothetical protein
MTARSLAGLAWLSLTVAIGGVALAVAEAALKVSSWANRQGEGGERR